METPSSLLSTTSGIGRTKVVAASSTRAGATFSNTCTIEGNLVTNEYGGISDGYFPAGSYTQVSCVSVPEFPTFGQFLLVVLLFPVLLIATRRFRKTFA